MCPRRRSIDDATIARLACNLLIEQGAPAVTFAQVAAQCGLAPPTLVQRFATRQGMLEAAGVALRDRVGLAFVEANRRSAPLAALRTALMSLAPEVAAALSLADSVAMLQYSMELRKQISYALAEAVEAGELPHCDVAQLARTIQIGVVGAVGAARLEGGDHAAEVSHAIAAQLTDFI